MRTRRRSICVAGVAFPFVCRATGYNFTFPTLTSALYYVRAFLALGRPAAGLGSLGTYDPQGAAGTPIPSGGSLETWVKLPGGVVVRAHELGHNFGMSHDLIDKKRGILN